MHTDTSPQLDALHHDSPTFPGAEIRPATTATKRGALRRFTHWARFADGCGLAELEVDSASGEVLRLYYRIDTARTGTLEFVRREPATDVTSVFLGAAISVSRGMHRSFPGDTNACRGVLALVALLETRCAQSLRDLAPKTPRDRSSLH